MQNLFTIFKRYELFRTALFVIFAVLIGIIFERLQVSHHIQDQQITATNQLAKIKSELENAVNLNLNLIEGLTAYISANPDLTQNEFGKVAAVIIKKNPALRNIAAAPDLVIRYMFPVKGNEAAIGLDYTRSEQQRAAVFMAVEKRSTIIAGPLQLLQGGIAFVSRTPVFTKADAPESEEKLWGLISSVLDTEKFYAIAGLNNPELDLKIAIRGKDALGQSGDIFYGDASLFDDETVETVINLPYGSWYMVGKPKTGWSENYEGKLISRIVFVIALALLTYLLILNKVNAVERLNAERIAQQANSQKEMAQEASEIKSRFLANMSHELRTPMHAILSFSNLGLKRVEDRKIKEYLEKINTSGIRLTKLIDDLLDLSKLESGKLTPLLEQNNLTETVLEAIDEIGSLANEKNLSIDVNTDKPLVGFFDKSLILRVIINTLSNAIKFSDDGAGIQIILDEQSTESGKVLCYSIIDEGVGIPENELTDIFDSFIQSSKTKYHSQGTGLGLAISQEIIHLHQGEIWAESPPDGKTKGSVIHFTIPAQE
ncbi:MAG: ATP-binding protein [Gammaproteobacteria bacterium]|jgi:sensor domain CHASE-containing protein/two-component sensor histidine kinase